MKDFINLSLQDENRALLTKTFSWFSYQDIRTYSTPELALAETVSGLSFLQPHKKDIYIKGGDSPYTAKLGEYFSKKGLKVITDEKNLEKSICLIMSSDNPLTGEIFDHGKLTEGLAKKRVFSIYIHHMDFLTNSFSLDLQPYDVHIFCLSSNEAFSVLGSRAKKILASSPRTEVKLSSDTYKVKEDEEAVLSKEDRLAKELKDCKLYFTTADQNRIYDRLVFRIKGYNGEYVLNQLDISGSYTSSPCFWQHPYQLSWWHKLNDKEQWLILPQDVDIGEVIKNLKDL